MPTSENPDVWEVRIAEVQTGQDPGLADGE
jgi:hypothetical protein